MEPTLYFVRSFMQLALVCMVLVAALRHYVPTLRRGLFWRQVAALWIVLVVLAGTVWTQAAATLVGATWLAWTLRLPVRQWAGRRALRQQRQHARQRSRQIQPVRRSGPEVVIVEVPVPAAGSAQLADPQRVRVLEHTPSYALEVRRSR